jgi:probable rRNA maturation factor
VAQAGLLGELVICPAVLRDEARAQHKSARAHWAHMVVHGVLHLVGYDHELPDEARRMERREIRTLRRLGIANPYRSVTARTRRTEH